MGLLNTVHREKDGKKQPTRYYSKKQEDAIAKKLGGTRVKNSGATAWEKGDVQLDKWLIEAKTKMTSSASISIQKEWLEKLAHEALFMGKPHSALLFNFGPDQPNYAIINEELFETLLNTIDNGENNV